MIYDALEKQYKITPDTLSEILLWKNAHLAPVTSTQWRDQRLHERGRAETLRRWCSWGTWFLLDTYRQYAH